MEDGNGNQQMGKLELLRQAGTPPLELFLCLKIHLFLTFLLHLFRHISPLLCAAAEDKLVIRQPSAFVALQT